MKIIITIILFSMPCVNAMIEVRVPAGGSLVEARDAIRAKRRSGEKGGAVMVIESGTHNMNETLVIEAQDSDLAIRSSSGKMPLLIGGSLVRNLENHRGKILKADVSSLLRNGKKYRQLLFGGKRMILARYPNYTPEDPLYGGWAFVDSQSVDGKESKDAFPIKSRDLRVWNHPEDVEVDTYSGDAYWNTIRDFKSHDPATRIVSLSGPGCYEIKKHSRFRFQNALEELDSNGEWFLDPRSKYLYFWPPDGAGRGEVRLVTLESFVQIKEGAKNVCIERLGFTGCNGTAITLGNAENCLVAGCRFDTVGGYRGSNSAFYGAISVSGGRRNRIRGNDISYTGGSGVSVSGGDRATLVDARHEVVNNEIHHVGVFGKGGSGIDASGCGILIANNVIRDCPRMAVQMHGNRFIVEYNRMYRLCLETNDGGAVYTGGRDWLGGRGTIWRYNRIHDVVGCAQTSNGLKRPGFVFGLYPDDNAGGVDIVGNLIYRVGAAALHLHNSRDCMVENNIFAFGGSHLFDLQGLRSSEPRISEFLAVMIKGYESVSGQQAWKRMRGMGLHPKNAFRSDGTMMSGNVLRRNIMISDDPDVRYARISAASSKWNSIDGNLAWNGIHTIKTGYKSSNGTMMSEWEAWQKEGWDKNSIVADPLFVDVARDDFRLKTESPAIRKLGFVPLPIQKIGLVRDAWRQ